MVYAGNFLRAWLSSRRLSASSLVLRQAQKLLCHQSKGIILGRCCNTREIIRAEPKIEACEIRRTSARKGCSARALVRPAKCSAAWAVSCTTVCLTPGQTVARPPRNSSTNALLNPPPPGPLACGGIARQERWQERTRTTRILCLGTSIASRTKAYLQVLGSSKFKSAIHLACECHSLL